MISRTEIMLCVKCFKHSGNYLHKKKINWLQYLLMNKTVDIFEKFKRLELGEGDMLCIAFY